MGNNQPCQACQTCRSSFHLNFSQSQAFDAPFDFLHVFQSCFDLLGATAQRAPVHRARVRPRRIEHWTDRGQPGLAEVSPGKRFIVLTGSICCIGKWADATGIALFHCSTSVFRHVCRQRAMCRPCSTLPRAQMQLGILGIRYGAFPR